MAGLQPPAQVPDEVQASGDMSRKVNMGNAPNAVIDSIAEVHTKFLEYANIIARGGRLAPQFGDSLFYKEIFGQSRPCLIESDGGPPIEWSEVLDASLVPEDFQVQANGMYRCRVRGSWIEVSELNFIQIQTCPTEHSLRLLQDLSDEQLETRVRLKLSCILHHTTCHLRLFMDAVNHAIRALDIPSTTHTNVDTDAVGPMPAPDDFSVHPWVSRRDSSGHLDDLESSGSDIPHDANPQELSQTTGTVQNEFETTSEIQEEPRDESVSSQSGNRPQPTRARYSRMELEQAPAFLNHLVSTNPTGEEVEEQYYRKFRVSRTTRGIFGKFSTKGGWAIIQAHNQANRQQDMSS
ncbi:unnamed protein product [Penicillium nalgiovense]|nr:unnamed protein product [Penicillium nalgiovense]